MGSASGTVSAPEPVAAGPGEEQAAARSPSRHGIGAARLVGVTAPDGMQSCDRSFRPTSTTLFNDPSGSASAQLRIQTYLVTLIDCTPPANPDGSQASIHASFYALTYPPVRKALASAAGRGVSVQVLVNSHADRFQTWTDLVGALGSDATANSFAVTCWQGCLSPKQPPEPGGPTAGFSAHATSAESSTFLFTESSKAGAAALRTWIWDFADGTHATGPGPHTKTYSAAGIYRTSLTVLDSAGKSHSMTGSVTVPDSLEPMCPALHAKVFLFSTVGVGGDARRWVSAYGSGNPTRLQAGAGLNNLTVWVGHVTMYQVLDRYFADLVAGSRGELLTTSYFWTAALDRDVESGSPATTIHFMPATSGDVQLEILRSIECRYTINGKQRRTSIRISMYAFTRVELAVELWRMALERGCRVDLVYGTMSQRLRGADGAWLVDDAGAVMPWGPADCLATPPSKAFTTSAPGALVERLQATLLDGPAGPCAGGGLTGHLFGTRPGTWLDRTSPISGGRLTVTASCPVEAYFDTMLRVWALRCSGAAMFTHQKVMLVNGMVHGHVQEYVLTGSANWSATGLRANDDLVTELQDAPDIYRAYLKSYEHQKQMLVKAGGARLAG